MTHKSRPCGQVSHGPFSALAANLSGPVTEPGPAITRRPATPNQNGTRGRRKESFVRASSPDCDDITGRDVITAEKRDVTH